MNRKMLFTAFTVLLALTVSMFAQPPRMGKMKHPGWQHALQLTEEQQTQMQDLQLKFQKEILPLRTQLQKLRADLKLAITSDSYDEGKVNKIIQQMENVRTEIQKKRIAHQRAVRKLLTPEQQKKFDLHILKGKGGPDGMPMGPCPECGKGKGPRFRGEDRR